MSAMKQKTHPFENQVGFKTQSFQYIHGLI
jgi:hypothetical protein